MTPPEVPPTGPSVLARLADLPNPIHLEAGLHPPSTGCQVCSRARSLLDAFNRFQPHVVSEVVADVLPGQEGEAAPPPWIRVLEADGCQRYLGVPDQRTLEAFTDLLKETSEGLLLPPGPLRAQLEAPGRRLHLRLFVSASSSECGRAILLFGRTVRTVPRRLTLDVIDVDDLPRVARLFGVKTLPCATVGDFAHFVAPTSEADLLHVLQDVLPSGGWPPSRVV